MIDDPAVETPPLARSAHDHDELVAARWLAYAVRRARLYCETRFLAHGREEQPVAVQVTRARHRGSVADGPVEILA